MKALRLPDVGSRVLMDSRSGLVCCLAIRSRAAETLRAGLVRLGAVDRSGSAHDDDGISQVPERPFLYLCHILRPRPGLSPLA